MLEECRDVDVGQAFNDIPTNEPVKGKFGEERLDVEHVIREDISLQSDRTVLKASFSVRKDP